MSETTTKSASKAKDTAKDAATDTKDSTSTSSDSSSSSSSSSSDDGAKATKSSGGDAAPAASSGKSDVYYGKFSNVKNPAYRGGWDDIWGSGEEAPARKKPAKKKTLAPVVLSLDMADMPEDLRAGLAEFAQAELKRQKSRVSYDKRDKAGSVDWRIECRIER